MKLPDGIVSKFETKKSKIEIIQYELITCKNCKNYSPGEEETDSDWCYEWGGTTNENSFCSYAEKVGECTKCHIRTPIAKLEYVVKARNRRADDNNDWNELMVICDNCGHAIHVKKETING